MQRMKLHTSGIKLNKLGSIQDRTIRSYMIKESELDASKTEFMMLLALTNPSITETSKRDEWVKVVQKSWKGYLSKLFNYEIPETTPQEEQLKQYYENVVKKLSPTIRKDKKTGKLEVSGLDEMKL